MFLLFSVYLSVDVDWTIYVTKGKTINNIDYNKHNVTRTFDASSLLLDFFSFKFS
jgi:hypothetical protein